MKKIAQSFRGEGIKAQLLRGAGGTAGLKLINIGLALASGVLLARTLGPESYGAYTFILSLITLLGLPIKAGLLTLLVRETAKNHLGKKWSLAKGLLRTANRYVLGYSALVASISGLLAWQYWFGQDSVKAVTFIWALSLLPLIGFEGVRTGALRGLRWVVSSQIPELIVRPLILILLLGIALYLGKELTTVTAMKYHIVSAAIAFIVGSLLLWKALPKKIKEAEPEYTFKPWFASLVPLSLYSGLKMLDTQIPILFLGAMSTDENVGLLKVAATGAGLVAFILIAVNKAIAPQIVGIYRKGELAALQSLLINTARIIMASAIPIAIVLVAFGGEIVSVVFGEEYKGAALPLSVLCFAQLVNASVGCVAVALNMTGNEGLTVKASIIALATNVSLSFVLIPAIGLIGAAIAFAVAISLWNILLSYYLYKETGLKSFFLCRK